MDGNPTGKKMWERLSNDKRRVEYILEEYPQTRGDDRILHFWVCLVFYGINIMRDKMTFESFRALPAQETLARRRREWQEVREDLRPSERVLQKRIRRANAYYNHFAHSATLKDFEVV